MPPRADSATRAFALTDTFMPMKPAAAEARPPMANPIATVTLWTKMRATKSTRPTAPIVVYWRRRYAEAPSWTAADRLCMVSLPGESASRDLVVSSPYAIANPAHTSATTTP